VRKENTRIRKYAKAGINNIHTTKIGILKLSDVNVAEGD
jgi:hypothetical protein